MEFGQRALGNRSILADPRFLEIKQKLTQLLRIEILMPFAPVILKNLVRNI